MGSFQITRLLYNSVAEKLLRWLLSLVLLHQPNHLEHQGLKWRLSRTEMRLSRVKVKIWVILVSKEGATDTLEFGKSVRESMIRRVVTLAIR